ncbi:ribosome recycling factor [Dysgonomonas alginatilytica]|uniref:Ribosome-recycling factor n=1 Tax=Dysgonomonas alginatilytica TaxID=1605892 RepID=A0A2V3PSP7_9BACT|nr:ribosome recycling factor [Dysgonomonas alginatilytica]PXV68103.1 ribosome recycling factor [Dysgonomonas alginatilytica]
MTDIKDFEKKAEAKMQSTIEFLEETLAHIRAGKANPRILDGIKLDYYGNITPLTGVASVNTPDARTIVIQPWEKNMLSEIEKAIINSDLGLNPDNNGEMIRLSIPPLTEERRKALVKQSKQEAEDAKISVRNARRDVIDAAKKSVKEGTPEDVAKDAEASIQKIHDRYIKQIDELFAAKEREIMTV